MDLAEGTLLTLNYLMGEPSALEVNLGSGQVTPSRRGEGL